MAPRSSQSRRTGATSRWGLVAIVWVIILAGWLIALGWLVAPTMAGRGIDWQWAAWIPDWIWAVATVPSALLGGILATRLPQGRIVAAVVAVGALALPLSGVLARDLSLIHI